MALSSTDKESKQKFKTRMSVLRFFCYARNGIKRRNDGGHEPYNRCSFITHLGNPTTRQLRRASAFVNRNCKELAQSLWVVGKEYREALKRYQATKTENSWEKYVHGEGNKNSVSYRTHVAKMRGESLEDFRKNRMFKYFSYDLLPRLEERRRAAREIRESIEKINNIEHKIYDFFGIDYLKNERETRDAVMREVKDLESQGIIKIGRKGKISICGDSYS
jgi:hypothetical protein